MEYLGLDYLPLSNNAFFNFLSHFNPTKIKSLDIYIPGGVVDAGKSYEKLIHTSDTQRWSKPRTFLLFYFFRHLTSLKIYDHNHWLEHFSGHWWENSHGIMR